MQKLIRRLKKQHKNLNLELCSLLLDRDSQNEIKFDLLVEWQNIWENILKNELRRIKPTTLPWPKSFKLQRKQEVIMNCLRKDYTLITHGHLMAQED